MDILLCNAPVLTRSPHARLAPPLGLAYVASALMRAGYGVSAIDFNVSGLNLERVDKAVEWDTPRIIGLSAHTETYTAAVRIARRVKRIDPEIRIVMGGPHPSILPEKVLQEPDVDFVVLGEGEETMVELAGHILQGRGSPAGIQGIAYRDAAGSVKINGRRPPLNPDALPYPARDLFPLEFYRERWNVLAARGGCPFKCPFCSASQIWGARWNPRSPAAIVAEVKMLARAYGAGHVFFIDDIFTADRPRVHELARLLGGLESPLTWGCSTRIDCVDTALIRAMADSGCRGIQYGIESGSQRILDSVKGIRKAQAFEAVKASVEAGISVTCSFMIPFPDDTAETIRDTKRFMKEIIDAGAEVVISYTAPLPGTLFFEQAGELGLKILTGRWEEFDAKHNILETRNLSRHQVEQLMREIVDELGLTSRIGL